MRNMKILLNNWIHHLDIRQGIAQFTWHNLNAKIILGSATPSIETAENARNGKYGWVKLKERYGGVELPKD